MADILEVALSARKLDVEASPYDATAYGLGIIPVESDEGKKLYKEKQILLMRRAESVRRRLLDAYDVFMKLAFDEDVLAKTDAYVAPERLAKAQPGGLPWRKNLILESEPR